MKEEGLGFMVKSLFRSLLRAVKRFSFDCKVWCGWGRSWCVGRVGGYVTLSVVFPLHYKTSLLRVFAL